MLQIQFNALLLIFVPMINIELSRMSLQKVSGVCKFGKYIKASGDRVLRILLLIRLGAVTTSQERLLIDKASSRGGDVLRCVTLIIYLQLTDTRILQKCFPLHIINFKVPLRGSKSIRGFSYRKYCNALS